MSSIQNSGHSNRTKPPFDVSSHFVVYDNIGKDLMGYYERFPCKIEACCLCYVVKGSLKATINLTEFDVTAGDFVVLLPGGFLHISDMSDDLLISFEGYSSAFLKTVNFWKLISPIMQFVIKQPVLSLDERMGTFYRESFSIMTNHDEGVKFWAIVHDPQHRAVGADGCHRHAQ